MAKKKSNKNAMKKIDKQLDKLLKEKKEIEDIPVVDRREIEKKKNNINNKKDVVVTPSRKKKNSKKDAVVVKERNNTTKKKNVEKKNLSKKRTKKQEKPKVSESTMRFQKLEEEIRTLYDKVEDVVDDIETNKTVDVIPGKDIVITDTLVSTSKEDSSLDKEALIWNWIIVALLTIFMILFIAFVGFVIYVCTY